MRGRDLVGRWEETRGDKWTVMGHETVSKRTSNME
jgi:hypothetical protein